MIRYLLRYDCATTTILHEFEVDYPFGLEVYVLRSPSPRHHCLRPSNPDVLVGIEI